MKIIKISHLGIAVNSIEQGKNIWEDALGLEFEGSETVQEQKVTTAFFPVGESEVELLESTAPDGPVAKFLEKKGEGIHHVAFQVENLEAALAELKEKDMLPALLFSFSRRDCQNKARELAGGFNFSTNESHQLANKLFAAHVEPELNDLESVQLVKSVVSRGIGVHHAGLLPGLKLTVEKLFAQGHLKALYATETFALGVNMPARTVGFLNFRKFDGIRNMASIRDGLVWHRRRAPRILPDDEHCRMEACLNTSLGGKPRLAERCRAQFIKWTYVLIIDP